MNLKKTQVLMLDSQKNLSLITKNYFSTYNINIIPVMKLYQILDEVSREIPDCIILDTLLLTNKIYQFVTNLKHIDRFQHIPIIFLTSKGLTQDRILGYNLGCSAYLSKPFDPEELYSIIKNLTFHTQLPTNFILQNFLLLKEIKINTLRKFNEFKYRDSKVFLTNQELNILKKILDGQTIKQISLDSKTTKRNVEKYITRLLDKTQTKTVKELKSLPWDSILLYTYKQANDGNRTRE
nr:TctD-like protein [Cryptomonas sp. NIES-345]BDA98485.1 TctD-like protein [Cryptomonas sp. NIES-1327]